MNATPTLNAGDTAWMLTSTALVLLMTIPGLALFYGGMVRKKNVVSTVTQSFAIACLVTVLWMIAGYSIAFATNAGDNAIWGGLGKFMLAGVGVNSLSYTIPEFVFITFQMTFAIITPGADLRRLRGTDEILRHGLVQRALAAAGLLPDRALGLGRRFLGQRRRPRFRRRRGGPHQCRRRRAGVRARAGQARRFRNRKPRATQCRLHHDRRLALLWVGWFGFNAGSAVASNGLAGAALLNTQIAAAMAALTWMIIEVIHRHKPTLLGLATGAVAGLVAVTPASGFVNPSGALEVGLAGGGAAYFGAVALKHWGKYDDSLDAFGVHGVAGIVGALLTGVLADPAINPAGRNHSLAAQMLGVGVTIFYCAAATLAILMLVKHTIGLKVSKDNEREGLDLVLHGEVVQ